MLTPGSTLMPASLLCAVGVAIKATGFSPYLSKKYNRMSLFSWLVRKNRKTPFIERDIFIDESDQSSNTTTNLPHMNLTTPVTELSHQDMVLQVRQELDDFLATDQEPRGYQDALINPDSSNATENKEILKKQLDLKIERVLTLYNNKILDYDFHIKTRTENGMMDTVEEIKAEKEKIQEEIKKIRQLQEDARVNKGNGHLVILSYDRGFKRGLAALTSSKLFGKNLPHE